MPESNDELHQAPAYQEESEKLADVVRHIEEQRLSLDGQMPAKAAHQETADAIQEILQANADSLYSALDQPYFGRLDYFRKDLDEADEDPQEGQDEGAPPALQTIYLGIVLIRDKGVFSWTSPVGKLWYTQSYEDGYTAPRGYIPTRVDLKRYIRIREGQLKGLNDIFRRQLPAPATAKQDVLKGAVSGVGSDDGHLQVIVETIEPDQYENIANVSDKVLIVQGAAGSGKSEIGLHRIAYLLSPFNDISESERPTPSTTLFVGPSQAFLEYAADVLPALGVREGVHQVRFSDWLIGHLSVRTPSRPRIWNDLLARGEMRRFDERAETFKGSLAMADLIERHVTEVGGATRKRCLQLPTEIQGPSWTNRVSRARIRSAVSEVLQPSERGQRLNRCREDFIDRIARSVQPTAQDFQPLLFSVEGRRQPDRRELERRQAEVRDAVARWCDLAWRHIDFGEEYLAFLSNPDELIRLAGTDLPREVADELANSATSIRVRGFDDADLGALAYLDHLLNETVRRSYRHIVVDEAQDISPIEFKLLAASSTNNWFTVLGDTAQRLTPYRGVRGWRDLERVFGRSEIEVQRARRSYRSNRQITEFNNRILRTFDKNIPAPIPFEREGHRVEYNRHRNTAEMYEGIIEDIERIRSLDDLENAVIAILVRDQANLNRFRQFCDERGIDEIVLVEQEHHSASRIVLARIPDVKGLEYDAVIVMGVNESFTDTIFNKKLLYLATTRAKHYLGIHWSGQRSPILDSISDRGISSYRT